VSPLLHPPRGPFAAVALAVALSAPAAAQDGVGSGESVEPFPSLPQSANGVTRRRADEPPVTRVNTLGDVFRALRTCWHPGSSRATGQEITIQFAFKRNGEILGQPRITYYKPGGQEDDRDAFTRSVREAFVRCSPMPFTEAFGSAVAGRQFTFRFIDAVPL
jgi:hypothetical protein